MPDLAAARQFVHSHGRLLERRRFELLYGDAQGEPELVLRALEAYKNADGGFGLIEPDLRTPSSQPSAILYVFEVLAELGTPPPRELTDPALDWIDSITSADGGIPFVTAAADDFAHAPWWVPGDAPPASLLMTAGVASVAYRLGLDHPWLTKANAYVWAQIKHLKLSDAYAFRYVVQFLSAVPDRPRADAELDVLRDRLPEDGVLKVEGGIEGETLGVLEVAPRPDDAGRRLFPDALIDRELTELAAAQQDDGGWDFDWAAWNPAAAWEWRGMVTLTALNTLRANGRL